MAYRTKTYIAGDWTGDKSAVDQLHTWNESEHWGLTFHDAHDITQARDSSLNCSIKLSLAARMDVSKTFILIVGNGTTSRRAGECNYCQHCNYGRCNKGYSISNKSFIEYECDKAVRDGLKIIVLYNAATVDKTKCIESVKHTGTHVAMQYIANSTRYWNYADIKKAFSA